MLELAGAARALLTAERTALNFLQLLSAVATRTATYVRCRARHARRRSSTRARRCRAFGWRRSTRCAPAAATNHRIGLYDAILIKENHIAAAGGVRPRCAAAATRSLRRAKFVEIEVETLAQLDEALANGARMVLLDNMDLPTLREAVRRNDAAGDARAVLEISGGVTLDSVRALAETGVDRISVGALTKDVQGDRFLDAIPGGLSHEHLPSSTSTTSSRCAAATTAAQSATRARRGPACRPSRGRPSATP